MFTRVWVMFPVQVVVFVAARTPNIINFALFRPWIFLHSIFLKNQQNALIKIQ